MTSTTLALLGASSRCLFFGLKCACALKSHRPNPCRHRKACVGSGFRKFAILKLSDEHSDEGVPPICVGEKWTSTEVFLRHGGTSGSFWLCCHDLNYALQTFPNLVADGEPSHAHDDVPTMCFRNDITGWAQNKGSGGGMSIVGDPLTSASTVP